MAVDSAAHSEENWVASRGVMLVASTAPPLAASTVASTALYSADRSAGLKASSTVATMAATKDEC